jgi:hypothetical protein
MVLRTSDGLIAGADYIGPDLYPLTFEKYRSIVDVMARAAFADLAERADAMRPAETVEDLAKDIHAIRARLEKLRYEVDVLARDLADIIRSRPIGRKTAPKPSKG